MFQPKAGRPAIQVAFGATTMGLFAVLAPIPGLAQNYWPKSFDSEVGLAEICIEHPGAMGWANTLPITVIISDEAELTIHGESAVCYFGSAGEVKLALRFSYPYEVPNKPEQYWTTAPVTFEARKGKVTHLALCETAQGHNSSTWERSGWHDMWALRVASLNSADPCNR